MILSDLTPDALRHRLNGPGLWLRIAPVTLCIRSPLPALAHGLARHYGAYEILREGSFADFHVGLHPPAGLRRFLRPQVFFHFDAEKPFKPLPLNQAYAFLEWGLNWCMANRYHRYVVIHAAVLEKNGHAVVLPAPPGSGKSTLCAALMCHGWRLFSDELALCTPGTAELTPMPRPICLKNASIDVVERSFSVSASARIRDTRKGDIAYLSPSASAAVDTPALPRWIVFPRYEPGSTLDVAPVSRPETVVKLAEQCFNYSVLGRDAFASICAMVDRSDCLSLRYSRFDEVLHWFDEQAASHD